MSRDSGELLGVSRTCTVSFKPACIVHRKAFKGYGAITDRLLEGLPKFSLLGFQGFLVIV